MANKDIVVIGASTGGIEALRRVAANLAPNFGGTVFVVWHMAAESPRVLASLISRAGPLPGIYAEDDEEFTPGKIYVAPPDQHLLLDVGRIRLTRGPKENGFRPAVDPLFRSAARVYGPRVVGVILTGGLDDGTAGLQAIKSVGGTTVVQDPDEAFSPSMPASALLHIAVDHCLAIDEIGPKLNELTSIQTGSEKVALSQEIDTEVRIALGERAIDAGVEKLGKPSCFACPECHGVLLKLTDTTPKRFRCHTGHAYTEAALMADLAKKTHDSLWSAVRCLEEEALLLRHLADHPGRSQNGTERELLLARVSEIESRADVVRQATMKHEVPELAKQTRHSSKSAAS